MSTMMPPSDVQPIPPGIDKSGLIRRFSDENLAAAIDKAVAGIPPGKHVAAIAFADRVGAGISIVVNLGHGWSVMLYSSDATATSAPWTTTG